MPQHLDDEGGELKRLLGVEPRITRARVPGLEMAERDQLDDPKATRFPGCAARRSIVRRLGLSSELACASAGSERLATRALVARKSRRSRR